MRCDRASEYRHTKYNTSWCLAYAIVKEIKVWFSRYEVQLACQMPRSSQPEYEVQHKTEEFTWFKSTT